LTDHGRVAWLDVADKASAVLGLDAAGERWVVAIGAMEDVQGVLGYGPETI
jgi:hypothetical protein